MEKVPKLVLVNSKKILVGFGILVLLFFQPTWVLVASFESVACIGTLPKNKIDMNFSDSNFIEISIYAGISGYNEKFFNEDGINPWLP